MLTFIIPSKGRPTLANTIASLFIMGRYQEHLQWNAIIAFDNVEPTISNQKHSNIKAVVTPSKLGEGVNSAGKVRNYAVEQNTWFNEIQDLWYAFVDDDDTVHEQYITYVTSILRKHNWDLDLIIFRMQYQDGTILPQ